MAYRPTLPRDRVAGVATSPRMRVDSIMQSRPSRFLARGLVPFVIPVAVVVSVLGAVVTAGCAQVLGLERGEPREDASVVDPIDAGGSTRPDVTAAYRELILNTKPLAYYRFEETAGARVIENDPRLPNALERNGEARGVTLGLPGARGGVDRAMEAEAPGEHVLLTWPGIPTGVDGAQFSFELVVVPRAIDGELRVIVAHHDSAPGASAFAGYRLYAQNEELVFERATSKGERALVRADHALAVDRFTHVAVTFDGGRLRLFVGGVVKEERASFTLDGTGTTFVVGSRAPEDAPFAGRIDEVAIYGTEIDAAAMQAHAAQIR